MFDLKDGIEVYDSPDPWSYAGNKQSHLRVYGSDAETNGEVVFTITDNSSFSDGQHVARVSIQKRLVVEFLRVLIEECEK